jgi:hypothetical protein
MIVTYKQETLDFNAHSNATHRDHSVHENRR